MYTRLLNISTDTYAGDEELNAGILKHHPKLKESFKMIQELIKDGKITVDEMWHKKDCLNSYLGKDTLMIDKGKAEVISDEIGIIFGSMDLTIRKQAFTFFCQAVKDFDFPRAVVGIYAYMFLTHIDVLGAIYQTLNIEDKPMSQCEWDWFRNMSKSVIVDTIAEYLNIFRDLPTKKIETIQRVANKMRELGDFNELFAERSPSTPIH